MSYSILSSLYRLILCALITPLAILPIARAQVQASCTYNGFLAATRSIQYVGGVNDWGTVVGENNDFPPSTSEGFVYHQDGTIKYYSPLGASRTRFNARSNKGVTVGYYTDSSSVEHGFMLQGSTLIPVVDPKGVVIKGESTRPLGINKWNSIVGTYLIASGAHCGFKRWSNGGFIHLNYPGAQSTYANGINDLGVVVGAYYDLQNQEHGFIYHRGTWATLDYPGLEGTVLLGISNSGVVLGSTPDQPFLYMNGTFKNLPSSPSPFGGHEFYVPEYQGISPGGLLLSGRTPVIGITGFLIGWKGFTAVCK
jgi:hypothetical protein